MRLSRRDAEAPAVAGAGSRPTALLVVLAITWALVIARELVFVLYEQAFFDSDRAIVGLMAKHMAEGRAFPLFFYGQTYLLAAEAWFAVPFFLIGGASVATLHASQVALNLAVATMLIVGLTRYGGLRPWQAAVATAFFSFVPPLTAAFLIEEAGNIGPFVAIAALWFLRERPLWFGVVLAIGFLNREFTVYAIPAILLWQWWTGELWSTARVRSWVIAAVAALAVWQGVQALKPVSDLMGPGTRGQLLNGLSGSQVGNLANRMSMRVAEYPERAAAMFTVHVPRVLGALRVTQPVATQGRDWLFWVLLAGLGVPFLRACMITWRRGGREAAFGWYLFGVGTFAALGCMATRPNANVLDRYFMLVVLIPVGAAAVSLALDRARVWRALVVLTTVVWMASSAVDHVAHARRYMGGHQPDDIRVLIDGMIERGIVVAEAPYWRAYKITFMANERVIVASDDFIRVQEYRVRANAEGDRLVRLQERPCDETRAEERIGIWYLCRAR